MDLAKIIVDTAKSWLDSRVRYVHRGCTRRGCDCSGLIVGILQENGILTDYEMPNYPLDWLLHEKNRNNLTATIRQVAVQISFDQIQPGDILLFKFVKRISHAAVFIGEGQIIHCIAGRGVMLDVLRDTGHWGKRLVEAWRFNQGMLNSFKQ